MFRIGLIGKNISHSQSEEMYKKILKNQFIFKILDYESPSLIPDLEKLLLDFDGLCVTSPYKEFAFKHSNTSSSLEPLRSINCLKLLEKKVIGTNTDYYASIEILKDYKRKGITSVLILGDGAMSRVIAKACDEVGILYKISSRKIDSFKSLPTDMNLIVNCCSRDLNLSKLHIHPSNKVWDLNYNQPYEKDLMLKLGSNYVNGLDLLYAQAKFAANYWEIS